MTTEEPVCTCIYCNRSTDEFRNMRIIGSPELQGAGICFDCLPKLYDAFSEDIKPEAKTKKSSSGLKSFLKKVKILKPKEIKAKLDEFVIGQDAAKISLSVAIYNHYKKIINNVNDEKNFLDKSNVLMIGPSASGKCVCGTTKINLKNKKTGEKITVTVDEFKKMCGLAD